MKRWKFWSLIIISSGLMLYGMLMLLPLLSPSVDDSDLLVTRGIVVDGDNGFTSLENAALKLWWPEDQAQELVDLLNDTNWNASLAATALASNRETLAMLDAALTEPSFQVPAFNFDDDIDYLDDWKSLAHLAALRAETTFRDGAESEAFEQALALIRLGSRMQNGQGATIHYLLGSVVKGIGLSLIRRWTATTQLNPQQLAAVAANLQQAANGDAGLTNAVKSEYQSQKQFLSDLRDGKGPGQNGVPFRSSSLLPVYNHRQTQGKFANHARILLADMSHPYINARSIETNQPSTARLFLSGNAVGEVFFGMSASTAKTLLRRKCSENVQLEATRTLLALRACQLKRGHLPAALSELVPEFLDTIPLDGFDGKPLRYKPAERLIYSVGEDCHDDNGAATDVGKRPPDFVFPIPF